MRASLAFPLLGLFFLSVACPAVAQTMDPAIDRLITNAPGTCRDSKGQINPTPFTAANESGYTPCLPDNAAFHRLVSAYAFALAPTAMHSARTTGVGGFHIGLEAAYTGIDSGADEWKRGSRGSGTLADGNSGNSNPAGILQLYSVKIRKGFGYGFELGAQTGFMPQTSLWSTGADVRISLLEGFRKGIPGYIPDVAVGGGVRTITGTSQFQLTIASFDAQISKPLKVADAIVLTPWVGYQQLFTFIDSHVTDFTPNTDEEKICNSQGAALPGQAGPSEDGNTGRIVCASNGSGADFNNNRTFQSAQIERQRLILGLNLRHEILTFGVQFITDLFKPEDSQNSDVHKKELAGMPRQWTLGIDGGLFF